MELGWSGVEMELGVELELDNSRHSGIIEPWTRSERVDTVTHVI